MHVPYLPILEFLATAGVDTKARSILSFSVRMSPSMSHAVASSPTASGDGGSFPKEASIVQSVRSEKL